MLLKFFQVIFTELSRDEAQRNLLEMQRLLPKTGTQSYGKSSNKNVWFLYCYFEIVPFLFCVIMDKISVSMQNNTLVF